MASMLSYSPPVVRPASPKPLYAQVRDLLLARIRSGEWGAGESLPNEYTLSTEFDVSIGTVRRAVAELEENGVLVRKQGRGTFVAGRGASALQERFCGLRDLSGGRMVTAFELLRLVRRPALRSEADVLPAARGKDIIEIVQRLHGNGVAIGIERSTVPGALFPKLETQMRFGQHLYPVLADYGLIIARAEETIGIEPASAEAAAEIGCEIGAALLVVSRLAIAIDGQPVEWRIGRYCPTRVRYAGVS